MKKFLGFALAALVAAVVGCTKEPTPVASVTLDKTQATLIIGETVKLNATVTPDDAADKTVTWSSSDNTVATVVDGVVTAVKVGNAAITATAGEKTATCAVTVAPKEVAGITLDKTSAVLKKGETLKLTATVTPDDATDKTVTWKSSNTEVATVADGVVTAVAAGSATITASAGSKSATCEVLVPGPMSLQATIAANHARYMSFISTDVLGVFVNSASGSQANLEYTPEKVGIVEDYGMYVLTSEEATSPLKAKGEEALFTSGEHQVYAYMPYVKDASLNAVPVMDCTNQNVNGAVNYGKQFLPADWIFQYAKATVSSLGSKPVELQMECPYTMVCNSSKAGQYLVLPEEAAGLKLTEIKVIANAPIAYKNASFDIPAGKFNGEAVNELTYSAKLSSNKISSKFIICCDKAAAMTLDFTLEVTLSDGSVYTATSKLADSAVPDPVTFDDVPSVTFPTSAKFTKK